MRLKKAAAPSVFDPDDSSEAETGPGGGSEPADP
jgi:hypothetical protein